VDAFEEEVGGFSPHVFARLVNAGERDMAQSRQ
jgi:hypothetical protein